ncbi:MAG: apolipoprotein N-acyltransferase [Acidimicrobiales bacterium]|nr:MAG: apolipoprotein N-acyltransferase [Acidimicrobiales bacterium]
MTVPGRDGPTPGNRRGSVVVPALVAGGLTAASVPPLGWWPLAWLGLGLLAWRLRGLSARQRGLAGLAAGIALFGPTLYFTAAFNIGGWGILVVGEALFWALAAILVPPGRGRVLAFPAVLVLAEAARGAWPFGGIPMGGIDLGQMTGPLSPALRLGGPLLVTGLTALIGAALANLVEPANPVKPVSGVLWTICRTLREKLGQGTSDEPLSRGLAPIALCALAVVGLVLAGRLAPDGGAGVGRLQVAAVQGGGARGLRESEVDPAVVYQAQLAPTLALRPPLGVVLWPEGVIKLDGPITGSQASSQVGGLARSLGTTLVAGVTETVGATRFRNAAVAWGPNGDVVARYDKVHRVPFGEYVPARSLLAHLVSLSAVPRDALAGHGPGLLRTPAGPVGVMISYEVFYAGRGRAAIGAGGQVLMVPTNTASYSSNQVPTQELAAARMQAMSEGRDLVQAAPTGYTVVVDHRGLVLARSRLGARQVIERSVERRVGLTPYARGGDLPVLAAGALGLLATWAVARRQPATRVVRPGTGPRRRPLWPPGRGDAGPPRRRQTNPRRSGASGRASRRSVASSQPG